MIDPNTDLANILAWALLAAIGAALAWRFGERGR